MTKGTLEKIAANDLRQYRHPESTIRKVHVLEVWFGYQSFTCTVNQHFASRVRNIEVPSSCFIDSFISGLNPRNVNVHFCVREFVFIAHSRQTFENSSPSSVGDVEVEQFMCVWKVERVSLTCLFLSFDDFQYQSRFYLY